MSLDTKYVPLTPWYASYWRLFFSQEFQGKKTLDPEKNSKKLGTGKQVLGYMLASGGTTQLRTGR